MDLKPPHFVIVLRNVNKGARVEYVEAIAPVHQHLGEERGAHNWDDHERVAPRVRNMIGITCM